MQIPTAFIILMLTLPIAFGGYFDLKNSAQSLYEHLDSQSDAPTNIYFGTSLSDLSRKNVITLVYDDSHKGRINSWDGYIVEYTNLPETIPLFSGNLQPSDPLQPHCAAEAQFEFYPGEPIAGSNGLGTGSFIVEKNGEIFVASAKHVSGNVGEPVNYYHDDAEYNLGIVSYASGTTAVGDDFSLIDVDPEAKINPNIALLGGPTGLFRPDLLEPNYPVPIAKYGSTTKDTYGLLIAEGALNGEFVFVMHGNYGDSGSPIVIFNWPLEGDRLAVGILTHGIADPLGEIGGTALFGTPLHKKLELAGGELALGNGDFCGLSILEKLGLNSFLQTLFGIASNLNNEIPLV